MQLHSTALKIASVADVVEWHRDGGVWRPYPVEYKRGKPKAHRADEVQLCARALCLEAMTGLPVPEGAMFYGKTRRRLVVPLDDELRELTLGAIAAVRGMLAGGRTPAAIYEAKRCDACSLKEHCMPERLAAPPSVARWLHRRIEEAAS